MHIDKTKRTAFCLRALFTLALAFATLLSARPASAQIKQPGAHPDYSVELDPHLDLGWGGPFHGPFGNEGFGLGFRATIPIVKQGPISKINNSMGIGFGGDFLFYGDDDCHWGDRRFWNVYYDCHGNSFVFPVVLQWNFWLTPKISVFGEPGLAITYSHVEWEYPCGPGGAQVCDNDDSDTDFIPFILWGGGRFLLGDSVGITVRLGWPYISAGVGILI